MFKKIVSSVVLGALLINMIGLTGCTKVTKFSTAEVRNKTDLQGAAVTVYTTQDTIEFDAYCSTLDTAAGALMGYSKSHGFVVIALDDVVEVEARRPRWSRSVLPYFALFVAVTAIWISNDEWVFGAQ